MKTATLATVLLLLAAGVVAGSMPAAAGSRREARPLAQNLLLHLYGPVLSLPSGCTVTAALSPAGDAAGRDELCFESVTGGPAGDTILTANSTLSLVGGDLLGYSVVKQNAVTPFTSGVYAIPPELQDPDNAWLAFVEERTVTGGTKAFRNAHGSLRISGVIVENDEDGILWTDATIAADLR